MRHVAPADITAADLPDWMDRHHVDIIRTEATNLDGISFGKYVKREKFLGALPVGHAVADVALALDMEGVPLTTLWHPYRSAVLGDVVLRPDLTTLLTDGRDPDLAHVICDVTAVDGSPIELCPRTLLKHQQAALRDAGYEAKVAFELEFCLFREDFDTARARGFKDLTPAGARPQNGVYHTRAALAGKPFMDALVKRLNWRDIAWEAWNAEASTGQFELNFAPASPVTAADQLIRARQLLYEVAQDLDCSVTVMPSPSAHTASGLHIHHSLQRNGEAAFAASGGQLNETMQHWLGGLMATLPGAVSLLCPTINAYRRFEPFSAVPVTPTWGVENKSTAIRVVERSATQTRIEHRVASSEANPYLAVATILAGGLAGLSGQLAPPEPCDDLAWGLPAHVPRLPASLAQAFAATGNCAQLAAQLGDGFISYWCGTREHEWLRFHHAGGDTGAAPTDWELERYFALF